ncbi:MULTISPECIES: TetR/AcrR family transcriptional regulator [unclassified Streptomyces]|uniref:TetR/AcrR family transcriptional regulator n=1 Tax=unclassified Streptomyces TaxID=2593676 RepID=UPI00225B789C|nr:MULTISPECIES: TetR/AcrR family transcriptional regulator [unclassified Streptomyces]MCX5149115.1 TetR family transcriptional regulator [Streptomyces sp. NBC_00320]WSN52177.1 TetR family transcriptional regulator [Streptomyces sp. NBC_01296]
MSPRGVAIEGLRERLFAAAERVLARDGAAALTSRAVTEEAGCAKGVLHTHFAGLDEFVAELVLYRFGTAAALSEDLPSRAGTGSVGENLADVASAVLSLDPGLVGLAVTRPLAAQRVRQAWQAGAPGFTAIQEAVSGYLRAEQEIGRVATPLDVESVALALVGTLHHLLMTGSADAAPGSQAQVERLIRALIRTA